VTDVVVLGTGAAGLVAALSAFEAGALVEVYEKSAGIGGTTAISGGICWIPNNPHMAAGYPDYHPEHAGGKPGGGRSLDPRMFDFGTLGPWADRVVQPMRLPRTTLTETPLGGGSGIIDQETARARKARDARGRGQALIGALLKACLDRGIEPVTGARALELLTDDTGVVGVRVEIDGAVHDVEARRGVVLATGGFEWNRDLVKAFLRGPMTSPTGVPTNTGDGLVMALRAGAAVGMMSEAWWVPTAAIPGDELFDRPWPQLILRERTLPRSIMVNRKGQRFANEAANYNALGGAFHQFDPTRFEYANLPCWLVFDSEYLRSYGFAGSAPGAPPPAWLISATSLGGTTRSPRGTTPISLAVTAPTTDGAVISGS
jgi:3-oxosteroid 1-dehydrogenase